MFGLKRKGGFLPLLKAKVRRTSNQPRFSHEGKEKLTESFKIVFIKNEITLYARKNFWFLSSLLKAQYALPLAKLFLHEQNMIGCPLLKAFRGQQEH